MPRNRTTATGTAVTLAAETVVALLSGVVTKAGDTVDLEGSATLLAGTGTTAIVARVRRGSDTTGLLLGTTSTVSVTAGNRGVIVVQVSDSPPESSGLSYVLTVTQTGGTANGTLEQAAITALWGV